MNVWIVNPYGTLPTESWRPYRSTMLAEALVAAGHRLVWWVSNFDHRTKRYREGVHTSYQSKAFRVELVPASAYRRHISLERIRYEQSFAREFAKRAAGEASPDVLVLAEPALFTSGPVCEYLGQHPGTKLVVDIIDLWPELFAIALPRPLRFLANPCFSLLRARRARLMRRADAVVAVSADYLDIVPHGASSDRTVAYWGLNVREASAAVSVARQARAKSLLPPKAPPVGIVYAGTIGDNYDVMTIVTAAKLLQDRAVPCHFRIAGAGPRAEAVQRAVEHLGLRNVEFLGPLPSTKLPELYATSQIALSTYVASSTVSMPIKAYDYMAAGLALVNSLGRELGRIVVEHEIGLQYQAENAQSLADAIRRLVEDSDLLCRAQLNSLKLASVYDQRLQYAAFTAVLERVHRVPSPAAS